MSARRAVMVAAIAAIASGCARPAVAPLRYHDPLANDEPFRHEAPSAEPVPPTISLPWREVKLVNGVRVIHLERRSLPFVTAYLVLDRGAADLGIGNAALEVLQHLVAGGTAKRKGPELADAWTNLGASYAVSFRADGCWLRARLGAADLDAAVALLAEMAFEPRLSRESVDGAHARWAAGVASSRYAREAVLVRHTLMGLFGRDHAYGYTKPSVDRSRVPDFSAIHAKVVRPAHTTLVVVGDVTADIVDAAAKRHLGGWSTPSADPIPRATMAPSAPPGPHVIHTVNRDLAETRVAIVGRGPAPRDPDFAAFAVLGRIFGGTSSRLRGDIREERGAAYVFGAGVGRYRLASILTITSHLARSRAIPAIRAILDAIEAASDQGVDQGAVERARTSLVADWRSQMGRTEGIAAAATDAAILGIPLADVAAEPARIGAVTRADVRRVARKYMRADMLRVLVVGDAALGGELGKLGLGEVERRDEWGDAAR